MKTYDNYLFDLYGTLADIHTDEQSAAFWRSVSRLLGMQGIHRKPVELKLAYAEQIAILNRAARAALPEGSCPEIDLGIVFRSFFEDAGVEADDRTIADFARAFRLLSLKKLKLFPGVIPLLKKLRREGKKVYLLSNAQSLFTRPELTLLGLEEHFDGILLSSEAGRKKPDPEFYHILMRKYGLNPNRTVMVGNDDEADCRGAEAAGLDSCYVYTSQSPALTVPLPERCTQLQTIAELGRYVR